MSKVKKKKILDRFVPVTKFIDLPQRRMAIVSIEDGRVKPDLDTIEEGSIVKVVQRYNELEVESANSQLSKIMSILKSRSRYVRPPERIVIRNRVRRVKEIVNTLTVLESVQTWIEKRPSKKIDSEDIMAEFVKVMKDREVVEEERVEPADLIIHGMAIENFMPFQGRFFLDDIPTGLIGVVGEYRGQDDRSNRAGKSAFFDSILWALFGEARKFQNMEQNIYDDADHCEVGVAITVDGRLSILNRSLVRRMGTSVYLNDKVQTISTLKDMDHSARFRLKVKEANKEIESLIGMTKEDFVKTCFVQQGELRTILSQSSSKLKEDIIRWRGLKVWDVLNGIFRDTWGKLKDELETLIFKYDTFTEIIERPLPSMKKYKQAKNRLEEIRSNNDKARRAKKEIQQFEHQLSDAIRIEELEEEVEGLEELEGIEVEKRDKVEAAKKKYDTILSKYLETKNEHDKLRGMLQDGFDGVCPVDGEQCPRTDEINSEACSVQDAYDESKKNLKMLRDKKSESEDVLSECRDDLRKIERKIDKLKNYEEQIAEYRGPSVEECEEELERAKKRAKITIIDTYDLEEEIVKMRANFDRHDEAMKKLERLKTDIVNKEKEVEIHRYLKFMTSRYGIPSLLIEDSLEVIETQVNSILEKLGTDHRLRFESQRELKKPSTVCYECGFVFESNSKQKFCELCGAKRGKAFADELRPMIVEGERMQTYEQDSGGGKDLVALATRIAMSKFLGARILAFDEISASLDKYHRGLLVKFLRMLPEMGFNQVFVVSHQKEIDDSMDNKIMIERYQDENRSEVVIGA